MKKYICQKSGCKVQIEFKQKFCDEHHLWNDIQDIPSTSEWNEDIEMAMVRKSFEAAYALARKWPREHGYQFFIYQSRQLTKLLERLEEQRNAKVSA